VFLVECKLSNFIFFYDLYQTAISILYDISFLTLRNLIAFEFFKFSFKLNRNGSFREIACFHCSNMLYTLCVAVDVFPYFGHKSRLEIRAALCGATWLKNIIFASSGRR
jgi:hypothetical protein